MPAPIAGAAQPRGQANLGEAITRHAVTIITAAIALLSFGFSFGNVTMLALSLGIPPRIAWLVSPPVDLSVIGLLLGLRYLTQHGYPPERLRKPAWMLRLCAAITIALNTAVSCSTVPGQASIRMFIRKGTGSSAEKADLFT